MLRAISAGHFDLKHVEAEHDASAPVLEQGTGFHTDVRPAVFADIQKPGKRASLKETNTNDRSAPVIEKFPMDIKKVPPRKSVVQELKEKKPVIDALHEHNELHAKSEIEKHTRPGEPRSPAPQSPQAYWATVRRAAAASPRHILLLLRAAPDACACGGRLGTQI